MVNSNNKLMKIGIAKAEQGVIQFYFRKMPASTKFLGGFSFF